MSLVMKYFVLSPTSKDSQHAKASREAMRVYADMIMQVDPEWADDIRKWVGKSETEATKPTRCTCGYC